jgi:thiosulfate dehydrogenase [quinone] large subunit
MTLVADAADPVVLSDPISVAPSTHPAERTSLAELRSRPGEFLFRSTAMAPVWLVVRVWLGYEWLTSGWDKVHAAGPASWFGNAPALVGFVKGADATWAARAQAYGHPAVHYAWFVDFLDYVGDHAWFFGPVVVFSEILIGLGLITGTLTRWAAIAAVSLNLLYIFSGSAGVNGVFLLFGVLLICAWRVAGLIGVDGLVREARARRTTTA